MTRDISPHGEVARAGATVLMEAEKNAGSATYRDVAVRVWEAMEAALLSERERRTAQGVTVPEGWGPKIDGMINKLTALRYAFDMKGANATTILRVVNTLATMKAALDAPSLSTSAGGGERG